VRADHPRVVAVGRRFLGRRVEPLERGHARVAPGRELADQLLAGVDAIGEQAAHEAADRLGAARPAGVSQDLVEIGLHRRGRAVALLGIAGHRLEADLVEIARHRRRYRRRRRHLAGADLRDRLFLGLAVEEPAQGQRLPQHDAEGPDVRAPVGLCAVEELGREVAGLALDQPVVDRRPHPRHAEIDQLHRAGVEDDHVAGRDVLVDQLERVAGEAVQLVRRVQAGGAVGDDAGGRERIQPVEAARRAQHRRQRLALEVLHRDEERAVLLAEVVDVDDVRVLHQRGDPRLLEQHVRQLRPRRQRRSDRLDDDHLLELAGPALTRQVHLRHPALSDPRDELVLTESA
jgi:hypothetical protein